MLNTLAFSSLLRVSETLQSMYQMRLNKIHKFKPKFEIFSEMGPLILKTVTTSEELKAALKLRFEVFHQEMNGKNQILGVDVDEFDFVCDHIIIIEKKTGKVIGTYRLNCTLFSTEFYSAQEFNIRRLLEQPGEKLEFGRVCIHKAYRNSLVTTLLWRGLAEYMNATKSQILFGCATIKTSSPRHAALLHRHFLEELRMKSEYSVTPTPLFTMPLLKMWTHYLKSPLTAAEQNEIKDLIPSLCRSYLKIGAFVGGEPAWDSEFKCIDFLTILRREDLNKTLWKRDKLSSEA